MKKVVSQCSVVDSREQEPSIKEIRIRVVTLQVTYTFSIRMDHILRGSVRMLQCMSPHAGKEGREGVGAASDVPPSSQVCTNE